MTQLSVGFQAGAEGFSEMIFFQDKRAFDEFTSGNFEVGANVGAVVITAAASGTATTTGSTASASGGKKDAATAGRYDKGTAIFVISKGGPMYEASWGVGQRVIRNQILTNPSVDAQGRSTYRLAVVNNQLINKTFETTASNSDVYSFMISLRYLFN